MIYLLLCIFFSAFVLVTFKFAERLNVNSFSAILINYAAAFIFGFSIAGGNLQPLFSINIWHAIFMLLLGAWCIMIFRMVALSVQKTGVAVTTVASKMSVIIPILFSIYIDKNDSLSGIKTFGITLALIAVLLTIYRRNSFEQSSNGFYLPLLIFLGIGLIDASIKFAQITFVTSEMNAIFNASIFAVSGIVGLIMLPFNKAAMLGLKFRKTWIVGVILGVVNFSSMYFLIAALNYVNTNTGSPMHGSVLFGINNISVVVINVLIGLILFKEHPTRTNWVGILLSVIAITILAYGQRII